MVPKFQVCRIVCDNNLDNIAELYQHLKYFVKVEPYNEYIHDNTIPTLLVGYDKAKELYPTRIATQKQISINLSWTNNLESDRAVFISVVQTFIKRSFRSFLNDDNIISVDPLYDNIDEIQQSIPQNENISIHHNNSHITISFNDETSMIFNVGSAQLFANQIQKSYYDLIISILTSNYVITWDAEYSLCMDNNNVVLRDYYWIKHKKDIEIKDIFKTIKNITKFNIDGHYAYIIRKMYCSIEQNEIDSNILDGNELKFIKMMKKVHNVTEYLNSSEIKIDENVLNSVDLDQNSIRIASKIKKNINNSYIKSSYDCRKVPSGRISTKRGSPIDLIGLPKKSNLMKCFVSEFKNGIIISADHKNYEPRLCAYSSGNEKIIGIVEKDDAYIHASNILFGKRNRRYDAKIILNSLIYGSNNLETHVKKHHTENINGLEELWEIWSPVKKLKTEMEGSATPNYDGTFSFVNGFDRIITVDSRHKIFNQYIQSIAADVVIEQMFDLIKNLDSLNSHILYQKYDEIIFDVDNSEKDYVLKLIRDIMSKQRKYVKRFCINIKSGNSLADFN